MIMSKCVCCERADVTVGGAAEVQNQQGKQNTRGSLPETQDAYFIWKHLQSAGCDLQAVMNIRLITAGTHSSWYTSTLKCLKNHLMQCQVGFFLNEQFFFVALLRFYAIGGVL